MPTGHPRRSPKAGVYWREATGRRAAQFPCAVPAGANRHDVAIIGAGYTGLNAAIDLARAGRKVVVIDAAEPGDGASGRNAGHIAPIIGRTNPAAIGKRLGQSRGEAVARWIARADVAVFERIQALALACEADATGHLSLVSSTRKLARLRELPEAWARFGAVVTAVDSARAGEIVADKTACGGWIYAAGGYLNPYLYAIELARVAVESGVEICVRNPVVAARRDGSDWIVTTATGQVRARNLLIATNAARPDTGFALRRRGIPVACAMLASRPVAPDRYVDWRGPWTWADDALVFSGLRDTRGCMTTSLLAGRDTREASNLAALADGNFRRYFPGSPVPEWSCHWQGDFLLTGDGLPRLAELGEGCFAAFGFNGFGITLGTLAGIELAKLATGRRDALVYPVGPARPSIAGRLLPALMQNVMLPLARGPLLRRSRRAAR